LADLFIYLFMVNPLIDQSNWKTEKFTTVATKCWGVVKADWTTAQLSVLQPRHF